VRENEESEVRELIWGSPGTMLVAQALLEATGEERWLEAWQVSADLLWAEWHPHEETGCDLWTQHLYGKVRHIVGPMHGFAGNVFALWRGRDLLPDERRGELEKRAVATYRGLALRDDGLAQWLPEVEPPDSDRPMRTQWCHGAPGMVATGAGLARGDDGFTQLLVEGGELTWRAGPLVKGPSLCHGTAGNGYAFLKLLDRTGDELWLDRARRFAMHAIEQVERLRTEHGQGRYTLWTGDVGVALYLRSCLDAESAVPGYDLL
jgi:lantibiotic modifying enzyme